MLSVTNSKKAMYLFVFIKNYMYNCLINCFIMRNTSELVLVKYTIEIIQIK